MPKFTVLIIEDEKNIQTFVGKILKKQDYRVLYADCGKEGLNLIHSQCPDVIILDLGLPDMNGNDIIQEVRTWTSTPIIVISARSAEKEKVLALDQGADDYITKPFGTSELLARIRSMTRRRQKDREDLTTGTLTLKVGEGELSCTSSVRLSAKETALMKLLMLNEGKTLSTELLLSHVWQDEEEKGPGVVWIYISYLREKLRAIGSHCTIEGEENGSFRLVSQEAANG